MSEQRLRDHDALIGELEDRCDRLEAEIEELREELIVRTKALMIVLRGISSAYGVTWPDTPPGQA